jgi:hypothetical protein
MELHDLTRHPFRAADLEKAFLCIDGGRII